MSSARAGAGVGAVAGAGLLPQPSLTAILAELAGEVVTIEKFDRFAALARRNFEKNGLAGKIRLVVGDASEVVAGLRAGPPFDIVFIDGNKERYRDYMVATAPLLLVSAIVTWAGLKEQASSAPIARPQPVT